MQRQHLFKILLTTLIFCRCDRSIDPEKTNDNNSVELINYIDFKYNKVIAFVSVDPIEHFDTLLNKKINLSKYTDTLSRSLNDLQIKQLAEILSGKLNKDAREHIDCFSPRHTIAFLDTADVIINYISVGFDCHTIKSSKTQNGSIKNFIDFFNSIGLKVYELPVDHRPYYDSLTKLLHCR